MTIWWEALTTLQRVFALLAVPATLLLALQTVLLIIGLGQDGDSDGDLTADSDGDGIPDSFEASGHIDHFDPGGQPDFDYCDECGHGHHGGGIDHQQYDGSPDHSLRIFSLRTVVAFFAIFGWTGIVLTKSGLGEVLAAALSFAAGGLAMVLIAWLLKLVLDMQSAGNLDPRNAVGCEGTVYLTVPPARDGAGKVTVLLQGRLIELDAITDQTAAIATGTAVMVQAATDEFVLTVTPKEKYETGGKEIEA